MLDTRVVMTGLIKHPPVSLQSLSQSVDAVMFESNVAPECREGVLSLCFPENRPQVVDLTEAPLFDQGASEDTAEADNADKVTMQTCLLHTLE